MTRLTKCSVLIAAFLLLTGVSRAQGMSWRATRTPHFFIYYVQGRDSAAERAGVIAEKWNVIISKRLDSSSNGVTPIYLYPDRNSFFDDTGIKTDEATVGTAHTRTLVMRIDASGAYSDIDHIIPHELVHILIFRRLHSRAINMPLWAHEGLAKYLSNDWSEPDAELLRDAASGGDTIPLGRLQGAFPEDSHERSVAYVESYSAVRFMAEKYGKKSIPDLLSELADGKPWDEAMLNSIGITPERFESDWRQFLWERYGYNRWIKLGAGIVSALMAVFAVFAFRARRIQKKRKSDELQDEETWPDVDFE